MFGNLLIEHLIEIIPNHMEICLVCIVICTSLFEICPVCIVIIRSIDSSTKFVLRTYKFYINFIWICLGSSIFPTECVFDHCACCCNILTIRVLNCWSFNLSINFWNLSNLHCYHLCCMLICMSKCIDVFVQILILSFLGHHT